MRVSVRTLVEWYHMAGDLGMGSTARLMEGIIGHQALQKGAPAHIAIEVPVALEYCANGVDLQIHGRVDRLSEEEGLLTIEEIKTTHRDVYEITDEDNPVYWAQAECYAHMLLCQRGGEGANVRLIYRQVGTGAVCTLTRNLPRAALQQRFEQMALRYSEHIAKLFAHAAARDASIQQLPFLFPAFRQGQRELAGQVYRAIALHKQLTACAPTGIGKTAAVLYGALKAFAFENSGKLFYLSARNTGQAPAAEAIEGLHAQGLNIWAVQIAAKDRVCLQPTRDCRAQMCPYAKGYYDRVKPAIAHLQAQGGMLTTPRIQEAAQKHCVCPFELSLDVSSDCDVILCDYNYAFDPAAKLQRHFVMRKPPHALLIDEAHNLPSRAQEMFSGALSVKSLTAARRDEGKAHSRKHVLYKAYTNVINALKAEIALVENEHSAAPPLCLLDPLEQLLEITAEYEATPQGFIAIGEALSFQQALKNYDGDMRTIRQGKDGLRLFCVSPAARLSDALKRINSTVLFSATLNPPSFYKDVCGLQEDAAHFSLPSPFDPNNLLVMLYPLDTRYASRKDTLGELCQAIIAYLTHAKAGNYLIFFPSYAYLQMAQGILAQHNGITWLMQDRQMDDAARQAFLAKLTPQKQCVVAALAVMGGIFAEGIDLPGDALSGAVVVGVGLPQVGPERELMRQSYQEAYGDGFSYAYIYPGISRALQAAGRVIRTPGDVGSVLLIDARYLRAPYAQLLPNYWQVQRVNSAPGIAKAFSAWYHL